jgi:hypothetical protein
LQPVVDSRVSPMHGEPHLRFAPGKGGKPGQNECLSDRIGILTLSVVVQRQTMRVVPGSPRYDITEI